MAEQPKRRAWFQLHLSTCVVLMVVAGVLVWANVRNQGEAAMELVGDAGLYGWPYPCFASWYQDDYPKPGRVETPFSTAVKGRQVRSADYRGLAANIGVAMIILGLAALICEFSIYRRARKRAEKESTP